MLRNMTIRRQIILFLCISLTIIILFGTIYFAAVSRILKQKEIGYMDGMMRQYVDKINTITTEMERYASMITSNRFVHMALQENHPEEHLKNIWLLSNSAIMTPMQTNPNIIDVSIVSTDGAITGFVHKNFNMIEILDAQYDLYGAQPILPVYSGRIFSPIDGVNCFAYITTIFSSNPGSSLQDKTGTCIIFGSADYLSKTMGQISSTPSSVSMILDRNGGLITGGGNNPSIYEDLTRELEQIAGTQNGIGEIDCVLGPSLVRYQSIPSTGWTVVSVVPIREINSDLNPLLVFAFCFVVLAAIIFCGWCLQIHRSIASPIARLTSFLDQGVFHSLKNRLDVETGNEIGQIANYINKMLDELDTRTHQIINTQSNMYEMALAKNKAELSALQSQINPHFLYNTLDCIKGHAYLVNSPQIVEIADSLSVIMRYSIKGPDMVEVRQEIGVIEQYLDIIQLRFADRFTFVIDISHEAALVKIPRFILQPIVENAIYHGLEPKLSKGMLRITGRTEGSILFLEVVDNGVGMTESELDALQAKLADTAAQPGPAYTEKGLGLVNIHNRIRYIYGAAYGISLRKGEQEGLAVSLSLPREEEAITGSELGHAFLS